ncbi:MAG: hypothetical protein ACPH3L_05235 [Flavobacteriaceae bacterium]
MKKRTSLFFGCLLFSLFTNAQPSGPNKPTPEQLSNIRLSNDYRKITPYFSQNTTALSFSYDHEILNTKFVKKTFKPGTIFYEGIIINQDYDLRYNGLTDEIEIANNNLFKSVQKNIRISCLIGSSKYIYVKIKNKKKSEMSYLKEVYSNENIVLYEREVIIFKKAISKVKTYTNKDTPARFVKFLSYYTVNKEKHEATLVPNNTRRFIARFKKEHQKNIEMFIKENKINLERLDDLKLVFNYYKTQV